MVAELPRPDQYEYGLTRRCRDGDRLQKSLASVVQSDPHRRGWWSLLVGTLLATSGDGGDTLID